MENMGIDNYEGVFKNKTVLITGHTGFKGSWLSIWLNELGANVIGYALKPYTDRDNFVVTGLKEKINHLIGDIRDFNNLKDVFNKYKPEFVFHLAAQPIVRESYINPKETYDVNIGGTVNVLECCRLTGSVKVIINVTSDKCYENKEWVWGYRENDRLGGYDPYSSSKGCSELITNAYRRSFFNPDEYINHGKSISSARAGNVIGGGDWQKDRLIPDCIRALGNNQPVEIRNPYSTRPWQYVLEPLRGYILLASKMFNDPIHYSSAWNFGPDNDSVRQVGQIVKMIIEKWESGKCKFELNKNDPHEAELLSLDISKARNILNWKPKWNVEKCVEKTVEWYKNYKKLDMYNFCVNQIELENTSSNDYKSFNYSTDMNIK